MQLKILYDFNIFFNRNIPILNITNFSHKAKHVFQDFLNRFSFALDLEFVWLEVAKLFCNLLCFQLAV